MTTPAITTEPSAFSPKLKVYLYLGSALYLAITVIGLILVPFWLIFGAIWAERYYKSLKLELTERTVVIKKGVWFRKELTIPFDKIQDISIHEGPLLKAFGIMSLRIETAGQRNATTGQSDADLTGLIDARGMRDRILALRDAQLNNVPQSAAHSSSSQELLTEIRDALIRIENKLG